VLAASPGLLPDASRILAGRPDSGPYRQVGQPPATVGAARLKDRLINRQCRRRPGELTRRYGFWRSKRSGLCAVSQSASAETSRRSDVSAERSCHAAFMRCPDPATATTECSGSSARVSYGRGQVVAIPSIFGCRGVEAASAFERSLGGHGCPATIWAITAPAFKAYRRRTASSCSGTHRDQRASR
jgi:hypothetical protein